MWTARVIMLAAVLSIGGSAAAEPPAPPEYVEVLGRLKNLRYDSNYDPEDILGHGWITARLRITRVLTGPPLPPAVIVRYFSHTYYQAKSTMRLKLRRAEDGTYLICATPGSTGAQCP